METRGKAMMTWVPGKDAEMVTESARLAEVTRSRYLRALVRWYCAMEEEDAARARFELRQWLEE